MGISGDFGALRALQEKLDQAKLLGVVHVVAQRVAATSMKLVADEFRQGRDPYGNPWKPLKRQRNRKRDRTARERRARQGKEVRGDKVLDREGIMKGSYNAQANGTLVQGNFGVDYAVHHQYGAPKANIPQREMLPMESTGGLPEKWATAFARDADAEIRKALGGGK